MSQISQLEALLKGGSLSQADIESLPQLVELEIKRWWMTADLPRRHFKILKVHDQTLEVLDYWEEHAPYHLRLINRYLFEEDIATGELIHGNS